MPETIDEAGVETEEVFDATETTAMYFAGDVLSKVWLTWDNEQRVEFRNKLSDYVTVVNTLREKFDKAAWEAQDNGVLPMEFETIRARRDPNAEKPGRKATEKSVKDILLKK